MNTQRSSVAKCYKSEQPAHKRATYVQFNNQLLIFPTIILNISAKQLHCLLSLFLACAHCEKHPNPVYSTKQNVKLFIDRFSLDYTFSSVQHSSFNYGGQHTQFKNTHIDKKQHNQTIYCCPPCSLQDFCMVVLCLCAARTVYCQNDGISFIMCFLNFLCVAPSRPLL